MSTEQNVTVDPRCIKCGKRQSDHNWFGEFGYLCRNGSNTFEAEASSRLQQPIGGTEAQRLRAALSNIKELAEAADYLTGVPDFGVIVGYASAALSPVPIEAGEVEAWEGDLTAEEQAMIDGAWEKHKAAGPCDRAPEGWRCSRDYGHDGPCAASPTADRQAAELRVAIQRGLIAELGDTYDCTRVWEAWGVGTMDQDDFAPVLDRLDEIITTIANEIALLPPTGNSRGESGK